MTATLEAPALELTKDDLLPKPVTFESAQYLGLVVALPPKAKGGETCSWEGSPEENFSRQIMRFQNGKFVATTKDEMAQLVKLPQVYQQDMKPKKCRKCQRIWTSTEAWMDCETSHPDR
jgi:hypothetical protein